MQRIDLILVDKGLAQSRTHAQRLIKQGNVRVCLKNQWQTITKPGLKVELETEFAITADDTDRFVSRGALKLLDALQRHPLDLSGKVAIDVGQSTGGFTDCLLQEGIERVVGIEVGHDQLAARLRQDPRVICYEGMNARSLSDSLLQHCHNDGFDVAVMDVSFISQSKILPSLIPLIRPEGLLISLVKPQFEVGKAGIGRGGIVRDASLYPQVQESIVTLCHHLGMQVIDYQESPITGGDGNREFLLIAQR